METKCKLNQNPRERERVNPSSRLRTGNARKLLIFSAVILLAAFCFIPNSASAAAITSAQSGNWSDTATWAGGVVPGSGDTVTIGNSYTVTVNQNTTVGATVVEGGLTLGAYTLTMEGNLTIGNGASKDGTLTFGAGSTLALGANNLALNNCFLNDVTTNNSWAKITGTGSVTNGGVYAAPKQDIVLQYISFQNSGSIAFAVGGFNGTGETNRFICTNCVFSGGGLISIGTSGWTPTTTPITITYSDFRTTGTDIDYITLYSSRTSNSFSYNTVYGGGVHRYG